MIKDSLNNLDFFDENTSDLLREHRQVYLMINAISKRVRQLQLGERALALPASGSRDPLYIAEEEFRQDKLAITERTAPLHFAEEPEAGLPDMDVLLGLDDEEVSLDASDDEE
jgi:DNA-directed RNA polymerase subunit K/omega